MRRFAVVMVVLFCFALAGSASANLLLNGSFENANLDNWVRKGPATWNQWDFPTSEAKDGARAARFIDAGSGARENSAITQKAYFAGGYQGDVTVSGWVKRYVLDSNYALQTDWGWLAGAAYIDGTHGVNPASAVFFNYQYANDTWTYFTYTMKNVTVNSHIDIAIGWGLRGTAPSNYRTFDVLLVDGMTVVPEPGSMVALGTGLFGLVGFVIRRKK